MSLLRPFAWQSAVLAVLACWSTQSLGFAQDPDLYDDTVLRQIDLTVYDASGNIDPNFFARLRQNWQAGQDANLVADMTISGTDLPVPVTRTGVGLRIKGNSSFFFLPPGSQKASFNIEVDFQDPTADLWGYSTINLNNGIEDPTFCREIGFFRFIRRYTPAGLGNHVVVTINGNPWGVYVNIQQYNKRLLEEYFADGGGVRIKCPNSGGAALRWFGAAIASYFSDYELKSDGNLGTNAAWQTLVDACNALNNTPAGTPELIDEKFAIDGAIWSIVGENLFMDEDGYIQKGADFNVYWDPTNNRSVLQQHDGNESWGVSLFGWPGGVTTTLSPTHRFNSSNRPAISKLMAVPRWRERYFAHMRTMLEDFTWADFEDQLIGYRDLIDAAVQADPKKLYTYAQFQTNFISDTTVNIAGNNLPAPGLKRYLDDRRAFLLAHPEVNEPVPDIQWLTHSPYRPQPGQTVAVRTRVLAAPITSVGNVTLYYRAQPGRYLEVEMFDNGQGVDLTAGDGIYSIALPVTLNAGDFTEYYVSANSDLTAGSGMRFLPKYAEGRPNDIRVGFGPTGLRVTEVLYSGGDGEFFELTNTSAAPIDLTGWSMDDSSATPGVFDLSAAGTVAPGQSIVVTDGDAAAFTAAWGTGTAVVLGNNADAKLGRNDVIHIFDASNALHERFSYGDERYPYSARSNDESMWTCDVGLGLDDPYSWRSSDTGDPQASVTSALGDIGSPGRFTVAACGDLAFGDTYCTSNPNSTGQIGELTALGNPVVAANDFSLMGSKLPPNQFGFYLAGRTQGVTPMAGGSQGVLCLGGSIGRLLGTLAMSNGAGELTGSVNLFAIPEGASISAVMPGETWNFQLWHRDVNPTATSNFTEAIEVVFE